MMLQIKHAFELAQLYWHANFKKNIKKLTRKTNFFCIRIQLRFKFNYQLNLYKMASSDQ